MTDSAIISGARDTVDTDELFEDSAGVAMMNDLNLSTKSNSMAELVGKISDEEEISNIGTTLEGSIT